MFYTYIFLIKPQFECSVATCGSLAAHLNCGSRVYFCLKARYKCYRPCEPYSLCHYYIQFCCWSLRAAIGNRWIMCVAFYTKTLFTKASGVFSVDLWIELACEQLFADLYWVYIYSGLHIASKLTCSLCCVHGLSFCLDSFAGVRCMDETVGSLGSRGLAFFF